MITNDAAFDVLADVRRRRLLVRLLRDEPQPVPRLSSASREMLQAHETFLREYLSSSLEVADADKADVRTHHVHLPKLVEYSYIEWDRDADVVTRGEEFDDVRPLLEVVDSGRDGRLARVSIADREGAEGESVEFTVVPDR